MWLIKGAKDKKKTHFCFLGHQTCAKTIQLLGDMTKIRKNVKLFNQPLSVPCQEVVHLLLSRHQYLGFLGRIINKSIFIATNSVNKNEQEKENVFLEIKLKVHSKTKLTTQPYKPSQKVGKLKNMQMVI